MIRTGLLLLPVMLAYGQRVDPGKWTVRYHDGTGIEIRTESTGKNLPLSTNGSDTVREGFDFHRLVYTNDPQEGTVILGYDLEARRTAPGLFTIRIKPVDSTKVAVGGRGKWYPIPTISAVREFAGLHMGDAVQVDILSNPATGERIYDVLKVVATRVAPPPPAPVSERFSLYGPKVVVDGRTLREATIWMRGGALGIELPGRGRFYFGLQESAGIPSRPAAWVDRNVLRFSAGEELVEIVAKKNILERTQFATLWLYRQPDTSPAAAELARLRQSMAAARRTYSPGHPDVKAIESRIVALSQPVEFACGDDIEQLTRLTGKW